VEKEERGSSGWARRRNVATARKRHPFRTVELSLDYRDRYDIGSGRPALLVPGRRSTGSASLPRTPGAAPRGTPALDLRQGSTTNASRWKRASVWISFPRRTPSFGGASSPAPDSTVPRASFFRRRRGSAGFVGRFYLNERAAGGSGHYWIAVGRHSAGTRPRRPRSGLGSELTWTRPDPSRLFGDLGRVEEAPIPTVIGHSLAAAGLSYGLGPVRITAPVWVGRPKPGSAHGTSVLVSIQSLPMPF